MAKSKILCREHYKILKELGFEVGMYHLTTEVNSKTGDEFYMFEILGGLSDDIDFDEILEYLKLIKAAKQSDSPAVKDAFDQLRTVLGMFNE